MGLTRTRFSQSNTAIAKIQDPITVLNNESTIANVDVGFLINRNNGAKSNVAIFWSETGSEFATAITSANGIPDSNISVSSYANIRVGSLFGNVGGGSDQANVYITGSIIPSSNVAYDLGSSTNRFRSLWVSGNTIYVGRESISVDGAGMWSFTSGNTTINLGEAATFNNPTIITGNLTVTSNLTVQGTQFIANTVDVSFVDSAIELHTLPNLAPLTSDDGRDIGIKLHYYKTQDEHAFLGWVNDTGYLEWYDSGRETVGNVFTGNTYGTIKSGGLILANNTPSTSTTTGALKITGGAGIGGNLYAGNVNATTGSFNFVSGTITSNSQPNITDIGTLVNLDVVGSSQLSGFTTFQGSGSQEFTVKIVGPDKDKLAISTGESTSVGIGLYSLTNDESNYSNLRLQARSIDFRTGSTASNQNSKVRIDEIGNLLINTATTSTSTTTGALVVNGGVGIVGNAHADALYTTTGLFWSGNSQAFQSYGNVDLAAYLLNNTANISSNFFLGGNVVAGNVEISGNIYGSIVPSAIFKDFYIGTTAVPLSRGSAELTVDNFNTSGYAAQANLASLATNATKTTVTSNIASGTAYITFVSAASGNVDQNVNTGLTYNPNSGNLRAYGIITDTAIYWASNGALYGSADDTLRANVGAFQLFSNTNAASQATSIDSLNANIGSYQTFANANAASQQTQIDNIFSQANANTAAYLATYTGNVQVGNLIVTGNIRAASNVFANIFYVNDSIRWAGNGAVFASGGGGGGGITYTASNTAPGGPSIGDQWYYVASDILFEYINDGDSNQWVDVNGLGQTATSNITLIGNSTLQGNIVVQNNNLYSIGAASGYLLNIFSSTVTANTITVSQTLSANVVGNLTGNVAGNISNVSGNIYVTGNLVPTANLTQNIGSSNLWWGTFYGISTQAQYADLAENYIADADYKPGTVLIFGGDQEVTITNISHDTRIAGVVSTDPAYLMNAAKGNVSVALTGRVPCQVQGPVNKGTVLVSSSIAGVAQALNNEHYQPGCVIGKSLETIEDDMIKTIEIAVGRF